jgi:hypothetical protein
VGIEDVWPTDARDDPVFAASAESLCSTNLFLELSEQLSSFQHCSGSGSEAFITIEAIADFKSWLRVGWLASENLRKPRW